VWGYGRIGRQVARFGVAFGMKVWVWGHAGSLARALDDGLEAAPSRADFLVHSDVVSLHLRLAGVTQGLVTAEDLSRMHPRSLLINTGRAELIAPGALVAALQLGRPGFAAVDVYEDEPVLGASNPLLQLPNALCTPHIGYVARDSYENYFGIAFDNINRFAAGDPVNIVNPEVLRIRLQAD
jgi:D-3-phosphoglycerate dehydrogenase